MTDTKTEWRWNRNYHDHDQVAEFLPAFLEVHAQIVASGRYTYNDSFKGRIPGIEGPDEDTAIYLLQGLKSLRELDEQVAAALADGFERLEGHTGTAKFSKVVHYGWYMGGTGWQEWSDARVVANGCHSLVLLPKGKRTRGYYLSGKVLVKR